MKILSNILSIKNIPYKNKNVKLGMFDLAHEREAKELYYAQDVIGNYARANHAKISFQEATQRMNDKNFEDYLHIKVNRNTKSAWKGNKSPDEAIIKYDSSLSDKPFLRRVYDAVQTLMGDPIAPIEKHSRDAYLKLVQSGKISL